MSDDRAEQFLLVNTLPWDRPISGPVSKYATTQRGEAGDETSARHWQDRTVNDDTYRLPPTDVPGFGYRVLHRDALVDAGDPPFDERPVVETDRYRAVFDRERGGIESLYDADLGTQLVDREAEYPLAGVVREELGEEGLDDPRERFFRAPPADEDNPDGLWNAAPEIVEEFRAETVDEPEQKWGYQQGWFGRRYGPDRVRRHRVYETPLGVEVRQDLVVDGLASDVAMTVRFPDASDEIVVEATWEQDGDTHPQSTYLAFPFALDDPTARIDVGGQAMRPGTDQLAGTNHDSYSVQRWADLSDEDRGVTVACPLNPMVQFGDFHFGDAQESFALDRAMLLGWVATNYYNTNFRANQPGRVRARYHLAPHDRFDEARAHRVGRNAEHTDPLTQPLTEPPATTGLDSRGQLLDIPEPPILVTAIQPERDGLLSPFPGSADRGEKRTSGTLLLNLLNASDDPRTATIDSGLLAIDDATPADVAGTSEPSVDIDDRTARVHLDGRELGAVRVTVE